MALFDFLGQLGRRFRKLSSGPAKLSRVDDLLRLWHDQLEKPAKGMGGLNSLQLAEKHIAEGRLDRALWNLTGHINLCFMLANLYWGQGDLDRARTYLEKTLERFHRFVEICDRPDLPFETYGFYVEFAYAKCAAVLLGVPIRGSARITDPEPGYEPWFKNALMNACLGSDDFDANAWQDSLDQWTKRGFPKYRVEEFGFYVKALTGSFASADEMFAQHQRLLAGRSKRNPDAGLIDGYHDSELVIDYLFAAVLKRIGWDGTYRHSWPHTDVFGSAAVTTRQPDRYLGTIALTVPDPDADTGIIADRQLARRYIDQHLENQVDHFEGQRHEARRPDSERRKVAGILKGLGWTRDPATLDLMQAYRMDCVLNDRTSLTLCDPIGGDNDLLTWTRFLQESCGLPADFIGIAGNIEAAYPDLEGAWHVYRKKDRKVYLLDRDEWEQPEAAIRAARVGLNVWPSYTSFVAWWVAEHQLGPA